VISFKKLITPVFSAKSWRVFKKYVGLGGASKLAAINDRASLAEFLDTRASFVAQTSLYGYMKTRAGTRFPELFEDPGMLESINIAKWQIWLACLSDLTIFLGGLVSLRTGAADDQVRNLLKLSIADVLGKTGVPGDAGPDFEESVEKLQTRLNNFSWSDFTDDETVFSTSPEATAYWAPVIDEFKKRDKKIVINSVRFRWQETRREARRLLEAEKLLDNTADE